MESLCKGFQPWLGVGAWVWEVMMAMMRGFNAHVENGGKEREWDDFLDFSLERELTIPNFLTLASSLFGKFHCFFILGLGMIMF